MATELLVREDKIIRVVTTEEDRVIDFEDITGRTEPDDCYNEAPWDNCDGWDHETRELGYYDDDGLRESRGYARTNWNSPNVLIELDDADIIDKWGHTRRDGESSKYGLNGLRGSSGLHWINW